MSNKTGRPSDYDPVETLKKVELYLNEYRSLGQEIPTVAGLALYLDVSRSTVQLWATQEDKAEFSGALEKIKANQEVLLLSGGLSGTMNPTITKLVLANHGYSDKVETKQDHTSSDGSMTPRITLDDFYGE